MQRVGLLAFEESIWPSLERTRAFYLEAIKAVYATYVPDIAASGVAGEAPDAIVNFMGAAGWQLPVLPACPLIFGMHGGAILDQAFLQAHLGRLRTTDMLLVNCDADVRILNGMFAGEGPMCLQLPLPVDTRYFHPVDQQVARGQLPLADTDYVIGFVCRLLPQKNLHRYLALLQALKVALPGKRIKGIIIGKYWVDYPVLNYVTADYPAYIQQLIRQYGLQGDLLYFPGNLSNEELGMCYNAMDLLVHPTNSIDENFGYAPVEAMACGTPVIGAAYGGVKDTVLGGETGYLMRTWITAAGIRMDSLGALEATIRLLSDSAERERMSAAALARAAYYSRSNCSTMLCDAIATAIARYQEGAGKPVTLRPAPALSVPGGYLPDIQLPWEHFAAPVSYYVSEQAPAIQHDDRVYLAAALQPAGDDGVVLDDPAWPARYTLSDAERVIVAQCSEPVVVATLLQQAEISAIQRLVDIGLLCYTRAVN